MVLIVTKTPAGLFRSFSGVFLGALIVSPEVIFFKTASLARFNRKKPSSSVN